MKETGEAAYKCNCSASGWSSIDVKQKHGNLTMLMYTGKRTTHQMFLMQEMISRQKLLHIILSGMRILKGIDIIQTRKIEAKTPCLE